MKKRTKQILLSIAGAFVIGIGLLSSLAYYWFAADSPLNRATTIATIRGWGRLAPFPESAQRLTLSTTGNIFTRGFRASFTAPASDIERWLQESPGTNEVPPSVPNPHIRHFQIDPGGGAQFAEVTVDDSLHLVSIYVWWS